MISNTQLPRLHADRFLVSLLPAGLDGAMLILGMIDLAYGNRAWRSDVVAAAMTPSVAGKGALASATTPASRANAFRGKGVQLEPASPKPASTASC